MLYDKRWDAKVQTDPFAIEALIAWLEKQPARKRYSFFDQCGCLMHRYLTAMNVKVGWVGGFDFTDGPQNTGNRTPLPKSFQEIAVLHPWTYGGALKRAVARR